MRMIQEKYPASTHPKLYPKSSHFYKNSTRLFGLFNTLIFITGWVILYFINEGSLVGEKGINPMLPWGYFMIQMMPTFILEIFGFRLSKLMKQADTRTKKSAQLAPRNLFQYISPALLAAVIIAYLGFVIFAYALEGFKFELGSKAFIVSMVLLLGYLFFFSMTAWLIYGKKLDPYQSHEDRIKTVSLVIKTYCFTLIACAFFLGFAVAVGSFNLKFLMPSAMSFFLQFIAVLSTGFMLHKNRIEDIDFDVYKADYSIK
jgi:MFS family permease